MSCLYGTNPVHRSEMVRERKREGGRESRKCGRALSIPVGVCSKYSCGRALSIPHSVSQHAGFFFEGTALGNLGPKTDPGLSLEKENLG